MICMKRLSQRRSFEGYNFLTALKRNKDAIKLYLAAVGGINAFPPFDWATFFITVGVGFLALLTKMAADAVDFYFGEVKL